MLTFALQILFVGFAAAAGLGGIGCMVRAGLAQRRAWLSTIEAFRTQLQFLAMTGLTSELPRAVGYALQTSTAGMTAGLAHRDYRRAHRHAVAGLDALAPHRSLDIVDRPGAAPTTLQA